MTFFKMNFLPAIKVVFLLFLLSVCIRLMTMPLVSRPDHVAHVSFGESHRAKPSLNDEFVAENFAESNARFEYMVSEIRSGAIAQDPQMRQMREAVVAGYMVLRSAPCSQDLRDAYGASVRKFLDEASLVSTFLGFRKAAKRISAEDYIFGDQVYSASGYFNAKVIEKIMPAIEDGLVSFGDLPWRYKILAFSGWERFKKRQLKCSSGEAADVQRPQRDLSNFDWNSFWGQSDSHQNDDYSYDYYDSSYEGSYHGDDGNLGRQQERLWNADRADEPIREERLPE